MGPPTLEGKFLSSFNVQLHESLPRQTALTVAGNRHVHFLGSERHHNESWSLANAVCHVKSRAAALPFKHMPMHAQCCAVPACMHPNPCMQTTSKDRQAEKLRLNAPHNKKLCSACTLQPQSIQQEASVRMHSTSLTQYRAAPNSATCQECSDQVRHVHRLRNDTPAAQLQGLDCLDRCLHC